MRVKGAVEKTEWEHFVCVWRKEGTVTGLSIKDWIGTRRAETHTGPHRGCTRPDTASLPCLPTVSLSFSLFHSPSLLLPQSLPWRAAILFPLKLMTPLGNVVSTHSSGPAITLYHSISFSSLSVSHSHIPSLSSLTLSRLHP